MRPNLPIPRAEPKVLNDDPKRRGLPLSSLYGLRRIPFVIPSLQNATSLMLSHAKHRSSAEPSPYYLRFRALQPANRTPRTIHLISHVPLRPHPVSMHCRLLGHYHSQQAGGCRVQIKAGDAARPPFPAADHRFDLTDIRQARRVESQCGQ